jgi:hypothetical protein
MKPNWVAIYTLKIKRMSYAFTWCRLEKLEDKTFGNRIHVLVNHDIAQYHWLKWPHALCYKKRGGDHSCMAGVAE